MTTSHCAGGGCLSAPLNDVPGSVLHIIDDVNMRIPPHKFLDGTLHADRLIQLGFIRNPGSMVRKRRNRNHWNTNKRQEKNQMQAVTGTSFVVQAAPPNVKLYHVNLRPN